MPLAFEVVSAALFVGLLLYLVSSLHWVEHSERVAGRASEVSRLSAEMEAGMRGFLITGDKSFLQPYEIARARSNGEMTALMDLVSDNPPQINRVRRVQALQTRWNDFAQEMISLRRNKQDYETAVRDGRGKSLTDEIRR